MKTQNSTRSKVLDCPYFGSTHFTFMLLGQRYEWCKWTHVTYIGISLNSQIRIDNISFDLIRTEINVKAEVKASDLEAIWNIPVVN
jgi:hypothetical protein